VTGRVERGKVKVGEEVEIVGIPTDDEASGDGNRDVSGSCWTKGWRETTWGLLLRERRRKKWSAGKCCASRRRFTPHTKFQGGSVRIDEGRRRGDTRRSSRGTVRSFTFGRRT